ncbi:MAG: hypothetical protein H6508_00370 [Calditrichaeota bacterium]|nr:hypothetical protein [Calditrichota bacterium]MCB9365627.1 hypothetical protein [Calditrichota bacterium]
MRTLLWCGLLWICGLQIVLAQEIAVPMDSTGRLFVVDAELDRKLGLFAEYAGFIEARLYQSGENEFYLEIQERQGDQVVRHRVPRTSEEIVELRARVSTAVVARAPDAVLNQEGRGGLLINSILLSMGYYGWAVPVATNAEGSGAVASYFFIGAAGVLAPYLMTEQRDVPRSVAMMDFYGGSRGIAHGIALYYATDPKRDSERAPYGWGVVGSVVERLAFGHFAARTKMSEGRAAVIGVGGDFGTGMTAILASGHDLWNSEHQSETGMLVLGGSVIGMVAGNVLATHGDYSRGDGYVLRGIGYLGAGIPAALADVTKQSGRTAADLATAGSVLGLGLGHYLLRDKEFSRSQGLTVLAVEIAVATLATSVMVAGEANDSESYSLAAVIGGTAGFALGYSNASRSGRVLTKADNLDFEFNPLPLLTEFPRGNSPEWTHRMTQAVTIAYRF